jgi:PAS domain-containing protein
LELAVEGRTDAQIALALNVSVATVNSYWVRIRGKLGAFSRTELVSDYLRNEAKLAQLALKEENRKLRVELAEARADMHRLSSDQPGFPKSSWHYHALHLLPEPVLVLEAPSTVVYANREAQFMYAAEAGELEGLTMKELSTSDMPDELREPCRQLFESSDMVREIVGLTEPYFAARRDGSNFRAIVSAQKFATDLGERVVATTREYLRDTEGIIQFLRRPLSYP